MELFFSLGEMIKFLKRNLIWLLIVAVVLCAGFGALTYLRFDPVYTADATVLVSCDTGNADTAASLQYSRTKSTAVAAESQEMAALASQALGIPQKQQSDYKVTATQVYDSQMIQIEVTGPDPQTTADYANFIAGKLPQRLTAAFPTPPLTITVWDAAAAPEAQTATSSVVKSILLGVLLSVILFVFYALIYLILSRKTRNTDFLSDTFDLKLLGTVRKNSKEDSTDDYRIIRSSVIANHPQKATLLLAAPKGHAKTANLAAGLGKALALAGRRVLVLDTHATGDAVKKLLQANPGKTAYDVLFAGAALEEAITPTNVPGVSLLRAVEDDSKVSSDILATPEFTKLHDTLKEQFDYILVYTAPVLESPDASNAVIYCDATILVARYNKTVFADFKAMFKLLAEQNTPVLGYVCTDYLE